MGNKILVEFDRKDLKQMCKDKIKEYHWSCCRECKQTDKELVGCLANIDCSYKIKEQDNGNKRTED